MTAALIPHPAASRHAFRAQVCRLVDRLITMLDEIDGDADLEDLGDDEPTLGSPVPHEIVSQVYWIGGYADDDRESDDEEHEPSLSAAENRTDQTRWASGGDDDLEWQCEDEGHDSDREPDHDGDFSWRETGDGPQ